MTTKPRKHTSKWDVAPRRGEFDYLLKEIRNEVARITPPPKEPPRAPRLHVDIELVDKRAAARAMKRADRWAAAVALWVLILGFLLFAWASSAFADGIHYGHWQDTKGRHGEVRREGRTTDWTDYGPSSEVRHCHQYFVGDQPQTSCN